MKEKRLRIMVLVCGIIVSMVIGEGIVRKYTLAPIVLDSHIIYQMYFHENPKICYAMKPFGRGLNAEGFRDDEFSLKKEPNEIRIIMLGDSITFGVPLK